MRYAVALLCLLYAVPSFAQFELGPRTSFWLVQADRTSSHGPVIGEEGLFPNATFAAIGDHWLTENWALGGAYTLTLGSGPFLMAIEGRASGRVLLTDRASLIATASLGYPYSPHTTWAMPSVGGDLGIVFTVGQMNVSGKERDVLASISLGVFHARFATSSMEAAAGEIVDVERGLNVTAYRITLGTTLGF